jgi:uncharacterized protein (DUF885 family)
MGEKMKLRKMKKIISLVLIVVVLTSLLVSCKQVNEKKELQQSFNEYMDQLFVEEFKDDAISVNFYLKNPNVYGLENEGINLNTLTKEEYDKSYTDTLTTLDYIKNNFTYEELTKDQQLTFDIVTDNLSRSLFLKDFYYYQTALGSYLGINSQLPMLLSELRFDTKNDIENYFKALSLTKECFESCVRLEKEKIEFGTSMPDFVLEKVVEQCNSFIDNSEEIFLIPLINEKIDATAFLTDDEKVEFKAQNVKLINEDFKNAYIYLRDECKLLVGKGTNQKSMYYLPEGKAYYQALFADSTGSDDTIEEAKILLETKKNELIDELVALMSSNSTLYDEVGNLSMTTNDAQTIVENYQDLIVGDFPEIPETNFEIYNIHESLQGNASPAMYFLSPIDDNDVTERIYLNPLSMDDTNYLFTTLGHEGYPGHLYQHVYLKNSKLPDIRKLLNYTGYAEGWATYVEYYVLKYADGNKDAIEYRRIITQLQYAVLCLTDIGINYEGWDLETVQHYLDELFIGADAKVVYEQMIEVPTNFMAYYYTLFEIERLKDTAIEELGTLYKDIDFHKAILDPGPAPLSIIENAVNQYIESTLSKK